MALGHNVDELLAGILTQIKIQSKEDKGEVMSARKYKSKTRLSASKSNSTTTTCSNISHAGRSLMNKLLKKNPSRSVEDLFQG